MYGVYMYVYMYMYVYVYVYNAFFLQFFKFEVLFYSNDFL